jgi:hypothetical protein
LQDLIIYPGSIEIVPFFRSDSLLFNERPSLVRSTRKGIEKRKFGFSGYCSVSLGQHMLDLEREVMIERGCVCRRLWYVLCFGALQISRGRETCAYAGLTRSREIGASHLSRLNCFSPLIPRSRRARPFLLSVGGGVTSTKLNQLSSDSSLCPYSVKTLSLTVTSCDLIGIGMNLARINCFDFDMVNHRVSKGRRQPCTASSSPVMD